MIGTDDHGGAPRVEAASLSAMADAAGADAMPRLIESFVADCANRESAIAAAARDGDLAGAAFHAHALTSSAATFGAAALAALARRLYVACDSGDAAAARRLAEMLVAEGAAARAEMAGHRDRFAESGRRGRETARR